MDHQYRENGARNIHSIIRWELMLNALQINKKVMPGIVLDVSVSQFYQSITVQI